MVFFCAKQVNAALLSAGVETGKNGSFLQINNNKALFKIPLSRSKKSNKKAF
jgi:hypothetical protein